MKENDALGPAAAAGTGRTAVEPEPRCLRCGHPVPERPMGCRGGGCPNCRHPYPLGDCSD